MGLFDGYVQLSNESGLSFMSVSKGGINFSKAVVDKLKSPRYISIWVNEEKKIILITPTDSENQDHSFLFSRGPTSTCGVLIHRKNLQRKISEMMGFANEGIQDTLYIDGEYFSNENTFGFDAKKAYKKQNNIR